MLVTDPETEFEEELHAFDSDVDVAIQCFYTWQTVHAAAPKSRKDLRPPESERGLLGSGFGLYSGQLSNRVRADFRYRQADP